MDESKQSRLPSVRAVLSSRVGFLAFAVVLIAAVSAGTSVAANLITSSDIKDGTIQGKDLKEEAVTTTRIAPGAVSSLRVKNHSLTSEDLTDDAINKLKGDKGPKGDPGPTGPQGPVGATG